MKPITCERRSYTREYHAHSHEFGQFLFPLEGSLEISTKVQELNLDSDSCFYIPPEINHEYRSMNRNEFLILDVPTHYVSPYTDTRTIPLDQQWTAIRYLLLEEVNRNHTDTSSLLNLTRYVTSQLESTTPASISYIHQHFKESIRIETLAAMEHYHLVYYSSWFKEKTGQTPKAYITKLRLEEAQQLLLTTSWSMQSISEELRFENSSSFSRWFSKSIGVSPLHYRTLHKG
ncbi:AraC family transcriptional regulator [Pontibacillus halophilus JSM 076056 = DSM 19796]|uniref:AraC family transcriptional regulator n=1 Tax=Pontibacillus halophilus JSM 076056 = DSM 19796 TaxID=1385510 RepID=A0A0A5GLT6_9BACI|nr:helix-turn-helix domain-containing protein [Pontibacillus halophilus]KGX92198.1 AraC family transcriptional regulator [Pontibacillus halophilus JSM 076056 = DSM 19796]